LPSIARKEKKLERELERRFHAFMNEWRSHIKEEIAIHDALLRGKRSFGEHLGDTRRIHEKFLKRLKKL
jgi:CYTH domain-containing protein